MKLATLSQRKHRRQTFAIRMAFALLSALLIASSYLLPVSSLSANRAASRLRRMPVVADAKDDDNRYASRRQAIGAIAKDENESRLLASEADDEGIPGDGEAEEDIEARNDWFLFQRTYPSGAIPVEARHKALVAASRIRIESAIAPTATRNWQSIGPSPTFSYFFNNWGMTSGRINALAVSPANPRIVIAGSATGGIWRSTDEGASFVPVSDDQVDLAVGSLAFSKSSPAIVYAGMGDIKGGYLGSGVLKSTDAGASWFRVSNNTLPSPGTVAKIEVDPTNANRVFIAQYSRLDVDKVTSSGFYLSTNGGTSWTRTLAGAPRDIAVDPSNPRTIYVGLSRIADDTDPPYGLYRSTDGGAAWATVFTAPVQYNVKPRRDFRVAIAPSNPQTIYMYFGGSINGGLQTQLWRSTDGGATWLELGTFGFDTAQFGYNTYITIDPNNANTVYIGSRDVYKSVDGGLSWTNITRSYSIFGNFYDYSPLSSNAHPDQHALAFAPGSSSQFYIGNDGGIYKTNDGGATFQSRNSTLTLAQFVGLALHPTDPTITYAGSQDNGTQRRFVELGRWQEIATGDGGHTVISPFDPGIVFINYVRGNIYRFVNNGRSFDTQVAFTDTFGEDFNVPRMLFYPPLTSNTVDATIYLGTWRLFLSTNLGDFWFAPSGDLDLTKGVTDKGADVLSAIGVGPANVNVIYTGSAQGRAMLSTNSGVTWADITNGLPDRSITSIKIDPTNPANAYLACSGFNTKHVFKTTDMGATWTDITGNLPDIPVSALLIDPVVPTTLYAGTDVGVFRLKDSSANWQAFNDGMPPVVVTEFAAQASGLIQVATYGRGIYEITPNPRPLISNVTWDGKKKFNIAGSGFDDQPRVIINNVDRTDRLSSIAVALLKFKAKAKKLGLIAGDNTVQVINSNDAASNVFTLKL
jgi:photosystem II stability/assembly factor-like uncharacterized protein